MQDTTRRRTNSAHVAHVPARRQATWAELVRWRGVSCVDKIYIFEIAMKNCLKYPSPVKIRDVAGTPSEHIDFQILIQGDPNQNLLLQMGIAP